MRYIVVILLLFILSVASLTAAAQEDEAKFNIVATTTQIADAVTNLCGDVCDVVSLISTGVDPHLYQPTEADITAMNRADAVFYNGLHLEGQFDTVFEALGETNTFTYAVSSVAQDQGFVLSAVPGSGITGADDPHIWFHPEVWSLIVQGMAEELSKLLPEHEEFFTENADAYTETILAVYEWAQEAMAQVPEEQRYLVTSHDAFQYYAAAFGWTVAAVQGISTQEEAGVGDIQGTIAFVVNNELPAIFVESSVPPDTIEAVLEGAAARGWDTKVGVRNLYSDSMGDPDTFGGTYVGMFAENTITILQSYGYPIPEWPEGVEPAPPEELFELEDAE